MEIYNLQQQVRPDHYIRQQNIANVNAHVMEKMK